MSENRGSAHPDPSGHPRVRTVILQDHFPAEVQACGEFGFVWQLRPEG